MTATKRISWLDHRTAADPDAYVRRMRDTYRDDPRHYTFDIVSTDGTTATGRTRYTLRITRDADDRGL